LKNMYGKVMGCKNIFITHGHADHIGSSLVHGVLQP
jgi:glyoxylase-like metal-dependent hydrolase (beta-lactamase superfamily II)